MSNELKKFLDAKKSDSRMVGAIERHLMARPLGDRSTTVLHPSEIIKKDWCHRYGTYLLMGGQSKREKPGLRLQSIFDAGHGAHAKWQGYLAEMGVMYGKWTCDKCGFTSNILSTEPACVLHGTDSTFTYAEVALRDDDLRIAGHTDGWVKGLGDDFLIEIKTIGPGTIRIEASELMSDGSTFMEAWGRIRRPFRSHLLQGQMYLELAKRMYGDDAPKEIVFLYELKADQDYKEFVVKANYEIVERVFFEAEQVVGYAAKGVLPECSNDPVNGCKQCNLIEESWQSN